MIDGHNLIPKIRGLNLKAMDDELQLIELLQVYCRVRRRKIDVYFDGAPFGHAGRKNYGLVTAFFVRKGIQADDVIIEKLKKSRKKARNWIVVTSDRKIQANARAFGAGVIESEAFASEIEDVLSSASDNPADQSNDPQLSEKEVREWLELFSADNLEKDSEDLED